MFRWFRHPKRQRLHPVHLKGELVSVMRREKRELPHADYAPNYYQISLNPEDFQRWAGLKWKIIEQFRRYLEIEAHKEGYQLDADLFVDIQPASDLPIGRFRVEASFESVQSDEDAIPLWVPMLSHEDALWNPGEAAQKSSPPEGRPSPEDEGTVILRSTPTAPPPRLGTGRTPIALLKVVEGEDKGVSFYVDHVPITVGRIGKGADIALHDSRRYISRRQFEISRQADGEFQLTDLCCRDDLKVYVNGEQAEPTIPLYSGDRIRLGTARTSVAEMEFTVL